MSLVSHLRIDRLQDRSGNFARLPLTCCGPPSCAKHRGTPAPALPRRHHVPAAYACAGLRIAGRLQARTLGRIELVTLRLTKATDRDLDPRSVSDELA